MGPTWVLSAPGGPHVGLMDLAIWEHPLGAKTGGCWVVRCHHFRHENFQALSCDQAALWMVQSVRPSVRLPVCCPSHLFDYVSIIVSSWNFQELLPMTEVMSMQKVNVTEVKTQFSRFRTVTPVWIHIWCWNDAQSLGGPIIFQGHPKGGLEVRGGANRLENLKKKKTRGWEWGV